MIANLLKWLFIQYNRNSLRNKFFDGKLGRYVDYAITDVLQMMGRAGRPQFDKEGVACVLIHEPKKNFYKKILSQKQSILIIQV